MTPPAQTEKIAVIGLGYVGLPVALAFAEHFPTLGFDIKKSRVDELRAGRDSTHEVDSQALTASGLRLSTETGDLAGHSFFVVTVPTPIDGDNRPDLSPLRRASETVGAALQPGAIVVYESTVYPGVTEDFCAPILEQASGLRCGVDFTVGYSPERINPGDREHTLSKITKIVAGQDAHSTQRIADVYGTIVDAGLHVAPSIKVAEAAKVIENTQRDLNIALMNELAVICELLGIRTKDVLEAAGTKWNFLPFTPGLVGGHCIGVDPYYLTAKAEQLGYQPEVILAGRRINNGVGAFVAQRTMKMLGRLGMSITDAKIGVLGLTFKENVPDLRNSRVPDIISELREFGVGAIVHDPLGDPDEARREYGIDLRPLSELVDLDALILAVPHRSYLDEGEASIRHRVRDGGVVVDVKSALSPTTERGLSYWSL